MSARNTNPNLNSFSWLWPFSVGLDTGRVTGPTAMQIFSRIGVVQKRSCTRKAVIREQYSYKAGVKRRATALHPVGPFFALSTLIWSSRLPPEAMWLLCSLNQEITAITDDTAVNFQGHVCRNITRA